ncbi:MAG: ACP S-malonyltransferase [Candidatus Cloacimonetes bacterium]|nr:ACP S-malonyltransferase [Candidatus Cloacimonadota bacterium]MCF7815113.1 ACP S-malonyltransferase [Candidatus Cloacimonadota bacterium]MCF7868608.1 ACP S-malonyltransferase [Candidatus Cloacimonadota bacterium]MCF7882837.1 ACP S-malonyltransferase [Candidatus Cloacimonadota bacterium]
MSKIAFLFPGQGAQYVGMAMDFVQADPELEKVLINFDEQNNTDLYKIMKEGPEEQLKDTKYTQPAILFHSIAALRTVLKEFYIQPDFVAGHSLGEFSALVANGVLDLNDAMYLVHKRGKFMIEANDGQPFAMAAIIGPDSETVAKACEEASTAGVVVAANFNTPVQTVISGSKAGVDQACSILKETGAKRIVPLPVGGPFHSPLIQKAADWLKSEMEEITFYETHIPVISNVSAKPVTNTEIIKENLAKQVTSSVLWVDSIRFMIDKGVETFIEFGPKQVLAGMLKKIDRNAKVISIDTIETLKAVKEELEF